MLYDGNSQKAHNIENRYLDVFNAKSVVVKKALIVLKMSTFAAYKYTSF